jgi:hypothetical protein
MEQRDESFLLCFRHILTQIQYRQRPRQNFSSFFFNHEQAREAFGRKRVSLVIEGRHCIQQTTLKKISATQP